MFAKEKIVMPVSLEHHLLKADLDGAARALNIAIHREDTAVLHEGGGRGRVLRAKLPIVTPVCARFVREGLLERAKKLFVEEVEVGSSWFDDVVYVVTSTPDATSALLKERRVQQALVMLVDPTRCVEIERDEVRVLDEDAVDDGRDAMVELLALAAHVAGTHRS
jgi:hypothetical protein